MSEPVLITRVFDAPKEKVWRAWTQAEQIKKWWGPKNFSAPVIKLEFKPGGKYLYCMRGSIAPGEPEQDFYSGGEFLEIVPQEKIVLTDYFTDAEGDFVPPSHYGMGEMPERMKVTILFENAGENKTKLTLQYHEAIPDAHRADMAQGWNEQLDKLAESVA